jgi:hypothetical protein
MACRTSQWWEVQRVPVQEIDLVVSDLGHEQRPSSTIPDDAMAATGTDPPSRFEVDAVAKIAAPDGAEPGR